MCQDIEYICPRSLTLCCPWSRRLRHLQGSWIESKLDLCQVISEERSFRLLKEGSFLGLSGCSQAFCTNTCILCSAG